MEGPVLSDSAASCVGRCASRSRNKLTLSLPQIFPSMEIVRSNKGQNKLCFQNGIFVKKKELKDGTIRWECVRRRCDGCHATVKTNERMQNPVPSGQHNHNICAAEVAVEKM